MQTIKGQMSDIVGQFSRVSYTDVAKEKQLPSRLSVGLPHCLQSNTGEKLAQAAELFAIAINLMTTLAIKCTTPNIMNQT